METPQTGYRVKEYHQPVKRYCQTLELKDDPALIKEYVKRHSEKEFWQDIGKEMQEVGILDMQIYLLGTRLFMIVETPLDFDWESAFEKLADMPRQREWEKYMSVFQEADADATSTEKWKLMDRIFHIYNQ